MFIVIKDHNSELHYVNPRYIIKITKEASITPRQKTNPKAVFFLDGAEPILSNINWEDVSSAITNLIGTTHYATSQTSKTEIF